MIGLRRCGSFGLLLVLALILSGCSDSDNNLVAPTPVPPPTPTPPAQTFTISGSISETAPTASQRVEGAQVSITGGPSTTTSADGTFTLAGVAAGTHALSMSKTDYVTQSVPVTVTSGNVSGVQVKLSPTPRTVHSEHEGEMRGDGPSCSGTSRSCHVYQTGAHHDGLVQVFLVWTEVDARFDIELRCDGDVVEESLDKEPRVRELRAEVKAGQQCEVHIIFTGDISKYGVFLTYPY